MRFLKSLARGILSLGFKFGLVFLAVVSVTVMIFGTSTALKQALRSSKIYDNLIDNVISVNNQGGDNINQGSSLTLNDLPIKQAANTAFSPGLIQRSAEQIIDSVYKWLRGGTTKPDFRINLSAPKLQFATAAADNAAARAQQLPACTLQQSRQLASTDTDPFTVPCLPPGTDISLVRNKVITDLANSQDFFKNPVITADSLPKNTQGKTILDNFAEAPRIFHWFLASPWIIGGLTLLSGGLLVVLYDEKRRGLWALAVILFGSGIFLLIGTWLFAYSLDQVNKPSGQLGRLANNAFQNDFLAILHSLSSTISHKLFVFGAVYAVLGTVTLLVLHVTKPNPLPAEPSAQPEEKLDPPEATSHPEK